MHARKTVRFTAILVVAATAATYGQAPPPPPPSPTLWSFLGIPQASYKIHAQLFNRRGNHPGIEKKPPLRGIADPANLQSDVPAIKAAAEVKQAEDLKPQKIKAIKYLASIGCGCYDKDKKITNALLAAMDDCTEEVRLEAVYAIMDAASAGGCEHCNQRCCCSEEIAMQLYKIAYELDDLGCHLEPSERVRAAAVDALRICCPSRLPVESIAPVPIEGGERPLPIEGGTPMIPPPPPPTPVIPDAPAPVPPPPPPPTAENRAAQVDPNHFLRDASNQSTTPDVPVESTPSSRRTARLRTISATPGQLTPVANSVAGSVSLFDRNRNLAHVHFSDGTYQPPVGGRLLVLIPGYEGLQIAGELEVIDSFPGSANARPLDGVDLVRIGRHAQIYPAVR